MTECSWKDTNLALFGSDVERAVKKESAEKEPAWLPVKKIDSTTTVAWRIKNFKLEPVPKEEMGKFFRGDSYIILHVEKVGDELLYDAHYWIGEQSTQDEYGTAAYKTVELDTYLDDKAIQHREVDGYESEKFRSYFKRIERLAGGYDSGFRHADKEKFQPRLLLFHCQAGGAHIEVSEVDFTSQSMVSSDVFVVDFGEEAYQWNGITSNKDEKFGAAQYLQYLETERSGRCKTSVIDESDQKESAELKKRLPNHAPKNKNTYGSVTKAIYKLSDETGKMKFSLVCQERLCKNALTEDDVLFINSGKQLYVYIGKNCSPAEKKNAFSYAQEYLKTCPNPLLPITVVSAGQSERELKSVLE